jgi:hypothetical protein
MMVTLAALEFIDRLVDLAPPVALRFGFYLRQAS